MTELEMDMMKVVFPTEEEMEAMALWYENLSKDEDLVDNEKVW